MCLINVQSPLDENVWIHTIYMLRKLTIIIHRKLVVVEFDDDDDDDIKNATRDTRSNLQHLNFNFHRNFSRLLSTFPPISGNFNSAASRTCHKFETFLRKKEGI